MESPPVEVILYTKTPCGLCDKAKAALLDISRDVKLTIVEIDIQSDPDIYKQYFERIPVVKIGETLLEAPLDFDTLKQVILANSG